MANTRPPTQSVRSVWTAKDEASLQELNERKARIMEENREPLRILAAALPTTHTNDIEDVVDWMISNAEAMRDALEPFDSGIRGS